MNKNKSLCGPRKALGKRTETKGKDGGRDNNCKKWERREIQETDKINHPGIQEGHKRKVMLRRQSAVGRAIENEKEEGQI